MNENIVTINGTDYAYRINRVKNTLAIHDPVMAIVSLDAPDEIRIYQHNGNEDKIIRDIRELMKSLDLNAQQ